VVDRHGESVDDLSGKGHCAGARRTHSVSFREREIDAPMPGIQADGGEGPHHCGCIKGRYASEPKAGTDDGCEYSEGDGGDHKAPHRTALSQYVNTLTRSRAGET
jgi:hypothetical protein